MTKSSFEAFVFIWDLISRPEAERPRPDQGLAGPTLVGDEVGWESV